jgi:hypothetical protein
MANSFCYFHSSSALSVETSPKRKYSLFFLIDYRELNGIGKEGWLGLDKQKQN